MPNTERVETMKQFVAITTALSCEKRLRIVMALRNGELCEGVITELVGLVPSTTSRHLWLLLQAGLVDSEKTGRCVCADGMLPTKSTTGAALEAGKGGSAQGPSDLLFGN